MTEPAQTEAPPPAAPPSPGEAEAKKIEELDGKLKEQENKYLYLYAEFENFKKRVQKERLDLLKFGWEPIARELLQTVDNLENALSHLPAGADKVWTDGVTLVLNQLKSMLAKQGIERLDTHLRPFDPSLHEAVAQEFSEQHAAGLILKEFRGGYTLHGRLLRPARVVISQGKMPQAADNSKENKKDSSA